MDELVFEVVQESEGGYCAECLTENIFTRFFFTAIIARLRLRRLLERT
jgi:hypothetical protein